MAVPQPGSAQRVLNPLSTASCTSFFSDASSGLNTKHYTVIPQQTNFGSDSRFWIILIFLLPKLIIDILGLFKGLYEPT